MKTLLHHLYDWSKDSPQTPAQAYKADSEWKKISVGELVERVESLANYLNSEGIGSGDIGLIFSYNSPEWTQMDLAFTLAGASSAGIYVNASARQIHYILKHSEAKVFVVDHVSSLKKIFGDNEPQSVAPSLSKIIVLKPEAEMPWGAISFESAMAKGRSLKARSYVEMMNALKPEERAVLIYTSGTTGQPKAISLSHANLSFAAQCYSASWDAPKNGRLFSFLPLAHIAERMVNLGMATTCRYTVYFCSSPLAIAAEMREVQPTVALCVPRLWDKLKEGMENRLKQLPEKKRKFIRWAMGVSMRYETRALQKKWISPWLKIQHRIADKKVLSELRRQLGLGEASRAASGAAALSPSTLEWFRSIGVRLIEAYALSESSGILTCGVGDEETAYTVGVPYPGIELRLAEDGEIEVRGPNVFQGYFKDEAATREVLKDGWLRTGDIGAFDEHGLLKILGRKREIIKNGEGKMISPLFLEAQLLANPMVDQAIVIGNERPYLVALITLPETIRNPRTEGGVVTDPKILEEIKNHLASVNRETASHERIKRFTVLAKPFSIENDEMTATMKLKRNVIESRYKDVIEAMYDRSTATAEASL